MGIKNEIRIGTIVKVIGGERAGEIYEVVGISNNDLFIEISNSVNLRVLKLSTMFFPLKTELWNILKTKRLSFREV